MKKLLTLSLSLLISLGVICSLSSCELLNEMFGWLEFTSNGDGTCSVTGIGKCKDADVVIPETSPQGDVVTSIGGGAFSECSGLTSIVIPTSVKSIGYGAFYGCDDLSNIEVDANNTTYKSESGNLYTKNGKTLVQYAIGKPNKSFVIPEGVEVIEEYAFYNAKNLSKIEISNSVTDIDNLAFSGCSNVWNIEVAAGNTKYKSEKGNLYTKDGNTLVHYAMGKTDRNFVIPDVVTTIEDFAFNSSPHLSRIEIPNSVTSIGFYAFSGCESLTSITIPDSVKDIDMGAFAGCKKLLSVEFGDNLKSISAYAFYGCESIMSLTLSDSITSIDCCAFEDCTNLSSITLGGNVTIIDTHAFYNCKSLTSIVIPNSITTIGDSAFYNCENLTSIVIPNSVTTIGDSAFYDCTSLTGVVIGNGTSFIGNAAFYGCTNLTDVYYTGSEADWKNISVRYDNSCLENKKIHYNYAL